MSANPGGFSSLQIKARADDTEGQKTPIKKKKGKNGDNSNSSSAAKRPLKTGGPRESIKTQRTDKTDTGSSSRANDMKQVYVVYNIDTTTE